MSKDLISEQLRIYSDNYLKFGVTPKGVRNNNEESQYLRFARILNSFNLSKPFSIHDIGCGTCAGPKALTGGRREVMRRRAAGRGWKRWRIACCRAPSPF